MNSIVTLLHSRFGPETRHRLTAQMERVRDELELANSRRDELNGWKEALSGALARVRSSPGDYGSEAVSLRLVLQDELADVDAEIARTRPTELHEQKARLRTQLDRCHCVADILARLGDENGRS